MKTLIFHLLLGFPIIVISQDLNYPNKVYNEKIEYRNIKYKIDFNTFNNNEIELEKESIEKNKKDIEEIADSIKIKYAEDIKKWSENVKYSNNRSKIFWGKLGGKKKEISLPCNCVKKNDTLTIASGFGFFGGAGIIVQINNKKFSSYFFEYLDEPVYKKNKNDDEFVQSIYVSAKYQSLILENEPKPNELIIGHLNFLTNPYYTESTQGKIFENYIDVEMYFKCLMVREYEE
ncbi:hypothetical protein GSB9_02740 [Flavobacteriaceae bacterium GSB9]|nr:hypothetical protein GSB9_02740 [Flavobacteriaceae bacterium GSB9]